MANKKKKALKKPVKKIVKKTAPKKTIKKVVKKNTAKKAAKKAQPKKVIKKTAVKKATKKVTAKPVAKPVVAKKAAVQIDYAKAITPLADRLVVKVSSGGEKVTAGGLIIPDTVSSVATGYLKAVVLAVGTGAKSKKGHLQPLDVKIGDTVLFSEHAGTKISFNSEELQIIHESDVMGIVQN
jgi:chaperonin GroES